MNVTGYVGYLKLSGLAWAMPAIHSKVNTLIAKEHRYEGQR